MALSNVAWLGRACARAVAEKGGTMSALASTSDAAAPRLGCWLTQGGARGYAAAAVGGPTGSSVGRSEQGSTTPRFYKRASAHRDEEHASHWCVKLDGRKLKTPTLKPLLLPNASLAHAIALEWEYQSSSAIRPFTMPLMQLATTAMDRTPVDRDENVATLLRYIHADPGLCRIDEPDSDLGKRHEEHWAPIVAWVRDEKGVPVFKNDSFIPSDQPADVVEKLRTHLYALDNWEFTCLYVLSTAVKSLLLAMALLEGQVTIDQGKDRTHPWPSPRKSGRKATETHTHAIVISFRTAFFC